MLIKIGVDISRLKRPMRRALNPIEHAFRRQTNQEPVITSTYDGNHSPSSLHYADLAVDLRLPPVVRTDLLELEKDLKKSLGTDFDVLLENNHLHIEYDPKG